MLEQKRVVVCLVFSSSFGSVNLDCVSSPSLQKKIPFMAALTLSTFCQLFYFVAAHLNHGTLSNSLSISKVCNFLCLLPSVILGSRIFAEFQQASEP